MTDQRDISAELRKRLDVLIALQLRTKPERGQAAPLRDQVETLSELGVRPKDIAEILGRTQTYVTKELATIRKKKGKQRR